MQHKHSSIQGSVGLSVHTVFTVKFHCFSVKPGPHQQQCRSNSVECYNVECCFDIVATVDRALDCVCGVNSGQ